MNQFRNVLMCILVGGLGVVILLTIAVTRSDDAGLVFFPLVFLTGTIGASINNYRRLLTLEFADGLSSPESPSEIRQRLMTMQIVMSAVIGGFFGIVVYMLFVSELLSGELFPSFKHVPSTGKPTGTGTGMTQLVRETHLASYKDAAKAIVWSFVAGFSEQFVPNLLDKLAKTAEGKVPGGPDGGTDDREGRGDS